MKRWTIYLLYSLIFLILPLFHWGLEYIYTKFLVWSLLFSFIILLSDELPLPGKKSVLFLLPFIISLISLILFSDHPLWGYHLTMLFLLFLFFPLFLFHHFKKIHRGNLLLLILLTIPLLTIEVVGILQFFKILPLPIDRYGKPDPGSLVGLSNFASHYIVIILPAVIFLMSREIKNKILSISVIFITLSLSLYYLAIAANRASFVALLVILLLWVAMQIRKQWREILITSAAALLILFATGTLNRAYRRFITTFNFSDPAIGYRLHLWEASLKALPHNLSGMGMGDFRFEIWKYIDYYLKKMTVTGDIIIQHAHNEYIEATLEGSLLLLFSILLILFLSIARSRSEERFTIYPIASASTVSFFSFPMHMPLSLFVTAIFVTGKEYFHNLFIWKKNFPYRILLFLLFFIHSLFLFNLSTAEYHSRRGINFIIKKDYNSCEKEFTEAISHFREEPDYFYNRAVCRENLKLTGGAIRDLKEAIKISPYQPQPYKFLGVLYLKENNKQEGIRWLKKYLNLTGEPIEVQPIHFVIAASLDIGDVATAGKYLKIAERRFPSNKIILLDKLAYLLATKKYRKAEKLSGAIEKMFASLPPEYYMMKAQLLIHLNRSPLPSLKILIQKKPDPQLILTYLLEIKREKGEKRALEEMENILKKNPSLLNYLLRNREMREILRRGEKR